MQNQGAAVLQVEARDAPGLDTIKQGQAQQGTEKKSSSTSPCTRLLQMYQHEVQHDMTMQRTAAYDFSEADG